MCQEVKAKQYVHLLGRCTKNRPSTTKVLMTKYSTRMMTVMADITKPVGRFREENALLNILYTCTKQASYKCING